MYFRYIFNIFILESCLIIYSSPLQQQQQQQQHQQPTTVNGNEIVFLNDKNEYITAYLTLDDNRISSSSHKDFQIENENFGINLKLFPFNTDNLDNVIKYEYYSRDIPHGIKITNETDLKQLINITKPTKLVTHGWMSGGERDSCIGIKDGFLYKYDANVIIMDWSYIADEVLYPLPLTTISDIGQHYGQWLNHLIDNIGVNPNDIHLVGHSLGAHISGFAGRVVKNGKVARITGLDPAGPGFGHHGIVASGTLTKTDAHFVDVIHTCAGILGFKNPLGHVDFYPNGGTPAQPGCNIYEVFKACSHSISWKMFASSLKRSQPYLCTKCHSVIDAINKQCNGTIEAPLGDPVSSDTRGVFYGPILADQLVYHDAYDN